MKAVVLPLAMVVVACTSTSPTVGTTASAATATTPTTGAPTTSAHPHTGISPAEVEAPVELSPEGYLVDARGHSLYLFVLDTGRTSSVSAPVPGHGRP